TLAKGTATQKSPYEELMQHLPYRLPPNAEGVFECKKGNKTEWAIEITITEFVSLGDHNDTVRFHTNVEALTPVQLLQRQATRDRLDQQEAERQKQIIDWIDQEKKEQERKRLEEQQKKQEQEQWRRDNAKKDIWYDYNIGHKVCRYGDLSYPYFTGTYALGKPQYDTHHQRGLLIGYLEGFNQDGYQLKIRMAGWASNEGSTPKPIDHPKMDGLTSQPGTVQWVDVK